MAEYYGQRADSAGLIVTEGTAPTPTAKATPAFGLWNQAQAESWKPVTAAVHAKGGRSSPAHAYGPREPPRQPARRSAVVAPSALAAPGQCSPTAGLQDFPCRRPWTRPECMRPSVATPGGPQRRGGRLRWRGSALGQRIPLEQFLSPTRNKREDAWGGSVDKRMRFVVERPARPSRPSAGQGGIRLSPMGQWGHASYLRWTKPNLKLADQLAAAGWFTSISRTMRPWAPRPCRNPLLPAQSWRARCYGGEPGPRSAEAALREGRRLVGVGGPAG